MILKSQQNTKLRRRIIDSIAYGCSIRIIAQNARVSACQGQDIKTAWSTERNDNGPWEPFYVMLRTVPPTPLVAMLRFSPCLRSALSHRINQHCGEGLAESINRSHNLASVVSYRRLWCKIVLLARKKKSGTPPPPRRCLFSSQATIPREDSRRENKQSNLRAGEGTESELLGGQCRNEPKSTRSRVSSLRRAPQRWWILLS